MNRLQRSLMWWYGVALFYTSLPAPARADIFLWNRLGSQQEIQQSEIGLNGTTTGGTFVPGVFGNAYQADSASDSKTFFPKEVIPWQRGTIEFWGKLTGYPVDMGINQKPSFVTVNDGQSTFLIGMNGNDGAGNGGLTGMAGKVNATGTGLYRHPSGWQYQEILGAGQESDWHHYALVWDKDGIAALGNQVVGVYLDGQLNSGRWQTNGPGGFAPLAGGRLDLIFSQRWADGESAAIDNLKIWDDVKLDFSDRFSEDGDPICATPEPSTWIMLISAVASLGLWKGRAWLGSRV